MAAFGAAGIVAVAAGSLGWLTRGGVAAAFFVGGAVLTGSGVQGGMLLGLFFCIRQHPHQTIAALRLCDG